MPIGTLTLSRWHITAIEMTAEGLPLTEVTAVSGESVGEAVTGQKYYDARPLTIKETVRDEADKLREAWMKDRALNKLGVAVILTHRHLLNAHLSHRRSARRYPSQ